MTLRELESLRLLPKNANIVQIKELIREDDSQLHFVFEFMPDGNLYQLMKYALMSRCSGSRTNQSSYSKTISNFDLTPDRVQSIISQVLKGLDHMHSQGFIHRGE